MSAPCSPCPQCGGSGTIDWGAYGIEDCGLCRGDGIIENEERDVHRGRSMNAKRSVWVVQSPWPDCYHMVHSVWTQREAANAVAEARGHSVSEIWLDDMDGWEANDPIDRAIRAKRDAGSPEP